jgi:protein-tyrosine phosphatase
MVPDSTWRGIDVNGNFAFAAAPEYSSVFKHLEEGHLPLLYHCTAGKDRTGVFSALLHLALGVPEQTVLADYALTDIYLPPNSQFVDEMMAASATELRSRLLMP